MTYNYNMGETKYEWNESKRQEILAARDLDIAAIGPELLRSPDLKVIDDDRRDYGEIRFRAFGIARGFRLCLVFTLRGDGEIIRLITIFIVNQKDWEKNYGRDS